MIRKLITAVIFIFALSIPTWAVDTPEVDMPEVPEVETPDIPEVDTPEVPNAEEQMEEEEEMQM